MNAYELADELERFGSFNGDVFFGTCAIMLRQQADRIAELEKDLALKTRDRDVFCNFTLAYEKRIEELKKTLLVKQLSDENLLKLFNYQEQKFNGMIVDSDFVLKGIRAIIKEVTE